MTHNNKLFKNLFICKSGSRRSQSPHKDDFLDLIKIFGKIGKIGNWHSIKNWLAQGSSEFATADRAVYCLLKHPEET